jgi:hypothetical protein
MTYPNFGDMNRDQLRAYMLEHRNDEVAFHAYMDRLATEPVLAHGTLADLEDGDRFAEILKQVQKLKRDRDSHQG